MFHAGVGLDDGNDSKKRLLAFEFSWVPGNALKDEMPVAIEKATPGSEWPLR
ncbi:MAG: hypothetical protein IPN64_02245 [Propionivibrio sp.]|uniref:hypothetical protein n=1 Tax=Propionivibrio sp. TaxID=2212460 RepID=UPI0025E18095|nr:hypothetical protein [Propionivibrio sp.]MBK7355076.1 hypothetical protein [Propionivibrio sp.]MBK8892904.1 hypothetical protein [Propionivibrio sp.]